MKKMRLSFLDQRIIINRRLGQVAVYRTKKKILGQVEQKQVRPEAKKDYLSFRSVKIIFRI